MTRARTGIVKKESLATDGMAAGRIAALAAEKLDALLPYITRYAPARGRVMVVPLAILALAFWQSWAVGVVFVITGPLIQYSWHWSVWPQKWPVSARWQRLGR